MFREAKQSRIFQDVVEQIEQAIIKGQLKAGDTLPAERELRSQFNTSRGTIREALRVLEQKGLIEIKLGAGGGAVVKTLDTEQVAQSLGLLIRFQRVSLRHLAEFRQDVEGDVVALAAERAGADDIRRVKALLQEAENYALEGPKMRDEFIRMDKQIHMELARISGNPIYLSVLQTVHDNIQLYYDQYLAMDEQELMANYADLCSIVEAVEAGDSSKARHFTRFHIHRFYEYMEKHARALPQA
jgi:DNA-binding FadR family transcriptional regulator